MANSATGSLGLKKSLNLSSIFPSLVALIGTQVLSTPAASPSAALAEDQHGAEPAARLLDGPTCHHSALRPN